MGLILFDLAQGTVSRRYQKLDRLGFMREIEHVIDEIIFT